MGVNRLPLQSTIPGYREFEYMLVVNPNEDLWQKINKIKEGFAVKYQSDHARWGKPHLLLASFNQYEMMEEKILNRLRILAMSYPPFKVELSDFGSFPSHTIYVNVTSKIPFQQLVKKLRSKAQRLLKMGKEKKPHFITEPHITIAGKLKPWQYEKGWLEYSRKHFSGKFIADHMSLYRRMAGEMKYRLVEHFSFQNLPVTTVQGVLFE